MPTKTENETKICHPDPICKSNKIDLLLWRQFGTGSFCSGLRLRTARLRQYLYISSDCKLFWRTKQILIFQQPVLNRAIGHVINIPTTQYWAKTHRLTSNIGQYQNYALLYVPGEFEEMLSMMLFCMRYYSATEPKTSSAVLHVSSSAGYLYISLLDPQNSFVGNSHLLFSKENTVFSLELAQGYNNTVTYSLRH